MSNRAEQHAEFGENSLRMIDQLTAKRVIEGGMMFLSNDDLSAIQAWATLAQAQFTAALYYRGQ